MQVASIVMYMAFDSYSLADSME